MAENMTQVLTVLVRQLLTRDLVSK